MRTRDDTSDDIPQKSRKTAQGILLNAKKLLGLAAARKAVDLLPSRRRSLLQRATDPENITRLAAVGLGVGVVGFVLTKIFVRLRRPIKESIEQGQELSAAVSEISEAAKAATDAAADAESNAGKTIAAVEELGRRLADGDDNGEEAADSDPSSNEGS